MKNYFLMWAEFQSEKIKNSMKGDSDSCPVVWMHLILLICVLKMIKW